eukprot:TRINITY_DN889_c0_g1_i2.p2 TRINITY_DN889_c0_g1~~TRINITY_DN889_c0_g1_i2.p2  ORF type:complete len:356 (-),score=145.25 TRINITY_DN889_c0_g1_i2:1379-2446(-)
MSSFRQFKYVKRPGNEEVNEEHYKLEEVPIPTIDDLQDGEILVKYIYFSVDPYMRIQQSSKNTWEEPFPLNEVQGGGAVGKVVLVKNSDENNNNNNDDNSDIKVGDYVYSYTGWTEYCVCKGGSVTKLDPESHLSYALSVLGMPGRTAYFGLLENGNPKEGETVVVSGAGGAVGSIVVQLAKIRGCKVVGIAGNPDKIKYLLDDLKVDAVVNYRNYPTALEMKQALADVCENGIDVYFDNVGGHITDAVFELINLKARIIICGQISQYNGGLDNPELGPRFLHKILYTRSTIQGILARDYTHRMPEMIEQMSIWINEGKVQYKETFIDGFENLPKALNSLFHGFNVGKLLVRVEE